MTVGERQTGGWGGGGGWRQVGWGWGWRQVGWGLGVETGWVGVGVETWLIGQYKKSEEQEVSDQGQTGNRERQEQLINICNIWLKNSHCSNYKNYTT